MNGLVCGDTVADIRVPHKGQIVDEVIDGAFEIVEGFDKVRQRRDAMRAVTLSNAEADILARAAIALKYEPDSTQPTPITEAQVLQPRRTADTGCDLWSRFNCLQENLTRGGLPTRAANGRRLHTRAVQGIDTSVKVNRALWMLADEMQRLKT